MYSIVERLTWHAKHWRHERLARAVLDTLPLVALDDGVILFSMIGTRVLLPYLVAVKSLHRALGRGRIVILDDGTLTDGDRAILAHHLDNPKIHHIADVDTGACPRGGTWERLLTILDLRADAYVIQLDSDTVTTGHQVAEVCSAIEANRSFSLRGDSGASLKDVAEFGRTVPPLPTGHVHVQLAFEAAVDRIRIPGLAQPRYFRGCSGFTGFAQAETGRGLAEALSVEGERLLGKQRWTEWGTEQLTSNFVIANEADPLLLRYDHYMNFWDEGLPRDPQLVHFVGTCRFHGRAYYDATREAIQELRAA